MHILHYSKLSAALHRTSLLLAISIHHYHYLECRFYNIARFTHDHYLECRLYNIASFAHDKLLVTFFCAEAIQWSTAPDTTLRSQNA